jgi:hypothetical protein
MLKFIRKIVTKILFWIDGVPFAILEKIMQITSIVKKVLQNPALDIVVELTKNNVDDEILHFLRTYIRQFAEYYGVATDAIRNCQQVAAPDKRIICYINAVVVATGKTYGEILKELVLWIADRKNINIYPSHIELIHEQTK